MWGGLLDCYAKMSTVLNDCNCSAISLIRSLLTRPINHECCRWYKFNKFWNNWDKWWNLKKRRHSKSVNCINGFIRLQIRKLLISPVSTKMITLVQASKYNTVPTFLWKIRKRWSDDSYKRYYSHSILLFFGQYTTV